MVISLDGQTLFRLVMDIFTSRFYSKHHRDMFLFDIWYAVASTERTSHILFKAFFEAFSMVESFFIHTGGEFFYPLSHKRNLSFNLFISLLFTGVGWFKLLLHTLLHCIENERLLGAIKKDDVLRERHIHVLIYEILETDAAFRKFQGAKESRKLVHHIIGKTFNEVLNHLCMLVSHLSYTDAIVSHAVTCPHLSLNVLSLINDVLQKIAELISTGNEN